MILPIAISFGQEKSLRDYMNEIGCSWGHRFDSTRFQNQIKALKNMLKNDSTDYKYLYSIAICYYQLKNEDSAKFYVQKSIRLKENFAMSYALLAKTFIKKNDDSAAFYYDLASKYETDLEQKKKYKFIVTNKHIKEENFIEAHKQIKEILAMDSLDFKANYYCVRLSNAIGLYQESKDRILASFQQFDFEDKHKDYKTKFLADLLTALFELNDMKNFALYWEQAQNTSLKGNQLSTFLKCTVLASYENKLNEKYQLEYGKHKNQILASVGDYFFKKGNCPKAKFYWGQISDESLKEKLPKWCE
jgi:tetratricopeptide (TPR) repeat protein